MVFEGIGSVDVKKDGYDHLFLLRKKAKVADEKEDGATAFDRNCRVCVVYL